MASSTSALINKRRFMRVAAMVLSLLMAIGSCGCAGTSSASKTELDQIPLAETGAQDAVGVVSIEVGDTVNDPVESLPVNISGTSIDGAKVNDIVQVRVGVSQKLDLEPGTYTFSFDAFTTPAGDKAYKGASSLYVFDGKTDKVVKLPIVLDEEKMAEIAAAKEAEKAAEAEAAAKAQAEAEAKAQAEAAARAQAASQAQANAGEGGTVYVAASGNGSKYHTNPNCSRMKGTISMTVSEAKAAGYTACSKCC